MLKFLFVLNLFFTFDEFSQKANINESMALYDEYLRVEFYSSVCEEEWHIREGRCFIERNIAEAQNESCC